METVPNEPTLRERAYFLQGKLKAVRERAAYYGSTIDSLTAGMDAANAEAEAIEAELRTLQQLHYADFAEQAREAS